MVTRPGALLAIAMSPSGSSGGCDDATGWCSAIETAPARTTRLEYQGDRTDIIPVGWIVLLRLAKASAKRRRLVARACDRRGAVAVRNRLTHFGHRW